MANDSGSGNSPWLGVALAGLSTGINAISRGGPKRQFKYNKKLAEYQNEINRANAEWAFQKDMELRKFQLDYDSPAAQMQRYKDAGLNPNLVYGQGTPGNMGDPGRFPTVPGVQVGAVDASSLGSLGTEFQQARLMAAQTDLTRTKNDESTYRSELIQAQRDVARANPYLNKGYVDSLVATMKATADMKSQEARFKLEEVMGTYGQTDVYKPQQRGMLMMQEQMDQLFTKHGIDRRKSGNLDADLKLKAEVFKSKEFQNDLQKIQVEWMKNGDITPQHIYQGIFMLLQSMMR